MTQDGKNVNTEKKRPYDPYKRRIRSFVTRAGRLSTAQERAINELSGEYCLPYQNTLLDFEKVFGRNADTILEIGFGMGDTTAQIAQNMPEKNFIGVEVHTPGVGALLKLISEKKLKNIRIIQHDAVEVLDMIPKESLSGVHIFFPDPWHKARHHKRRLIQPLFITRLVKHIKAGGYIHCATDWQNYAEQMLEVLANELTLENTSKSSTGYAERPEYRPTTKFEKRGLRLGHGVWDLVFRRNNNVCT